MRCVQIQDAEQTWKASLEKCKNLGGDLFSLNSPTDLEVSDLSRLYPTALGKEKKILSFAGHAVFFIS